MKKTIFLFLIGLIMFSTRSITKASAIETIYEFSEFSIIITEKYDNSYKGFSIEKTGVNSFYTIVLDNDKSYYVNGVTQYNDKYIVYGFTHVDNAVTYYDSFIIAFDNNGAIVFQQIKDYGSLEETTNVFVLDNILITSTDQHIDGFVPIKIKNYFTSYSLIFEEINEVEINNDYMNLTTNDSLILANLEFDSIYEYGINSNLDIIEQSNTLGIDNGTTFTSSVYLEFINQITINGNIHSEPFLLDYPGNYLMVINEVRTNFTIEPIVKGIDDNQITSDEVTIFFDSGNAMLNNDIYLSGETISAPGNYELIISGASGYYKSYNFVITSSISGIINNNIYTEPVTLLFNGEGYINNQFINSGDSFDEEGEYIFKINGENNYLETYYFEIKYPSENMSFIEIVQKFDIYILVTVLITGGIILKKK